MWGRNLIYKIVKKIPKGKVATYGEIAAIIKNSKLKSQNYNLKLKINPRLVGNILHKNPDPKNIPCHRVVDRNGRVANNFAFGGWKKQKELLLEEGVAFKDYTHVDLKKSLWKI